MYTRTFVPAWIALAVVAGVIGCGGQDAFSPADAGDAACIGCPLTLASGAMRPRGIALGGAYVYWTAADESDGHGFVARVPINGGAPSTLAFASAVPMSIVVTPAHVYWNEDGGNTMRADLE